MERQASVNRAIRKIKEQQGAQESDGEKSKNGTKVEICA